MTKFQPDDEFQFDTPFGKTYHAVAPPTQEGWCDGCSPDNCGGCSPDNCGGCAFEGNSAACSTAPPCTPDRRSDGHNIIWVAA